MPNSNNHKKKPEPSPYPRIGIRVDAALRHDLEELARADRRSLSNFIKTLLIECVESHKGPHV